MAEPKKRRAATEATVSPSPARALIDDLARRLSVSQDSRPAVAVLLPCYNEAATIAETVSAFRASMPEATLYVYDNNSTDGTAEIAREQHSAGGPHAGEVGGERPSEAVRHRPARGPDEEERGAADDGDHQRIDARALLGQPVAGTDGREHGGPG